MNNLKTTSAFILFCLVISGCALNRSYEFTVINYTNYSIDTLKLGCGKNSKKISISPTDTSQQFELPFKYIFAFTEPLLCVGISNYSDSKGKYKNSYGGVIGESSLYRNKQNILSIKLDPNPANASEIFLIETK